MSLAELSNLFASADNSVLLDQLVINHRPAITLAILNSDTSSPVGLQLLDNAYNAFRKSGAGAHFFKTDEYTQGVEILLDLFGLAYERLGHGKLSEIAAYTRAYSLQKRLQALSIIHNEIGFGLDYYTKKFSSIIQLLTDAQYDPTDTAADYTGHVLRILHLFKTKGTLRLQGNTTEFKSFLTLFKNEDNLNKWPLLAEDIEPVITLSNLDSRFNLSKAPSLPLSFSDIFSDIFKNIVSLPLRRDPRTIGGDLRKPLGYECNFAKRYIIENGTADFREKYNELSAYDRVMIYCLYNMRLHYITSYYLYSAFIDLFANTAKLDQRKPVFLDLGCGPMTSGLALADLFLQKFAKPIPLYYIGVDIAPAMLKKAEEFASNQTLFANTICYFRESLDEALSLLSETIKIVDNPIIINASYLFASSSLDPFEVAAFVSEIYIRCQNSSVYFIFQNPDKTSKNANYEIFKNRLEKLVPIFHKIVSVSYDLPDSRDTSRPGPVYYELLSYQR